MYSIMLLADCSAKNDWISPGTLIIAASSLVFTGLQFLLAREKHRQDWFDRRFTAYLSFQRLSLFASGMNVPGYESSTRGELLIEEAFFSKTQVRFLIAKSDYDNLETIYKEAFELISCRTVLLPLAADQGVDFYKAEWQKYENRRVAFEANLQRLYLLFQPYLRSSGWLSRTLRGD